MTACLHGDNIVTEHRPVVPDMPAFCGCFIARPVEPSSSEWRSDEAAAAHNKELMIMTRPESGTGWSGRRIEKGIK